LQFGLSAESGATACLLIKGYRILARRYKTPVGEIDIIARRRGTLVFVEVKARKSLDDAAAALTARQQARIIDAAQYWLAAHPDAVESRSASMLSWSRPANFPATCPPPSMRRSGVFEY